MSPIVNRGDFNRLPFSYLIMFSIGVGTGMVGTFVVLALLAAF
jgi:hypothetical protein